MAHVDFDSVTKVYDDQSNLIVAVEELDLNIRDGEFLVLVGPSGCGKSTTLRMIAGLETVTGGEIRIGDEVVNDRAPRDRDIAMVFQDYALYPHKTVYGNIAYGLQLSTNHDDEEIDRRVHEAVEMMGIEDLLEKKPGALSGGQQQRVATGRAIVREPEVFLFDEPLSNLDAKLRTHMRTELSRIHTELGITTIYVTHDQEEAMTMSDRIAVMNNGELQQVGTPKEVYFEPANLFVADFIGSPSINLVDVALDGDTLVHDAFEYGLNNEALSRIRESGADELVLGVRPEDVDVVQSGDVPADHAVTATVDVLETVGSDNFLYTRVGDREFRVRASSFVEPEVGSQVTLSFGVDDIHLFDRYTEDAVFHGPRRNQPMSEAMSSPGAEGAGTGD